MACPTIVITFISVRHASAGDLAYAIEKVALRVACAAAALVVVEIV